MTTEEQQKLIDNLEMCPECFTEYEDDDYLVGYESVPYGSTTAQFPVEHGVKCHNCGYKEEF